MGESVVGVGFIDESLADEKHEEKIFVRFFLQFFFAKKNEL
jgi:hypothetical protein